MSKQTLCCRIKNLNSRGRGLLPHRGIVAVGRQLKHALPLVKALTQHMRQHRRWRDFHTHPQHQSGNRRNPGKLVDRRRQHLGRLAGSLELGNRGDHGTRQSLSQGQ